MSPGIASGENERLSTSQRPGSFVRTTSHDAIAMKNINAVAVPIPIAEAAIDVDKPADLDLVEAILARREAGGRAA